MQKLLSQVAIKVPARDALSRLLAEAIVLTVTAKGALLWWRFSGMLATVSFEATFAVALELGTGALEPTVTGKEAGGVHLLVGWFRGAAPTELSKKKTKKSPECWSSNEGKSGNNISLYPLETSGHSGQSNVPECHSKNKDKEWPEYRKSKGKEVHGNTLKAGVQVELNTPS
jgi:hypothetical protein